MSRRAPLSKHLIIPLRAAVLVIAMISWVAESGLAQSSVGGLAEAEVRRRGLIISEQGAKMSEAESLTTAGKNEEAFAAFKAVLEALPSAPLADEARDRAIRGYLAAGVNRANDLAGKGDLAAARALLDEMESAGVADGKQVIQRTRKRLADADRFPPALTAAHVDRVAEVRRLLILANSELEIGNYDRALRTFEDVLRLDPYNEAARRGMERTEQKRDDYFKTSRDQRRSTALNAVNSTWEAPVPQSSSDISNLFGGTSRGGPASARQGGRDAILAKLRSLRIQRIDFTGATLEEVVEYMRVRSRDVDPEGRGIDFVVSVDDTSSLRPVTLNLTDVPFEDVLSYVGQMAGVRPLVEDFAVRLISLAADTGQLVLKSYQVPPDFITAAPVDTAGGGAAGAPDPFAQGAGAAAPTGLQLRRLTAKEFLESRGVSFPEGSSATFIAPTGTLSVRNTPRNIEIVDMLVEGAINQAPKQVVIDVKVLDVGENALKELGFDWLLGSFGIGDNQIAGGTTGNQQVGDFLGPLNFPARLAGAAVGGFPVTAGLRSSGALDANRTIEDVLYGASAPLSNRSPGVLSLAGVFTDPQFQVVLRALNQKTGLDLLVEPSVVVKSGQKATVQVVREMLYPTEFDPPQVPTNFGTINVIIIGGPPPQIPPAVVTPATPTAFEMRRVGVVLDAEPVISDDGRTVDITLTPEVTEFVGFVNYGSPIRAVGVTGDEGIELTENRIFQPIFSTRRVATAVKVYDGATIVLGGLISDSNILIEDKVPILGDVPGLGRLFRSKVTRRRMRNMIFFVTVNVIDPSGAKLRPAGAE